MSIDERLREGLHATDDALPTPDLDTALTAVRARAAHARRRNRVVALGAAAAIIVAVGGLALVRSDDAPPRPVGPVRTPEPDVDRTPSAATWVDTPVTRAVDGKGMAAPDPLRADRTEWFEVAVDHLEGGGSLVLRDVAPLGAAFERAAEGTDLAADTPSTSGYQTFGLIGLLTGGDHLDPSDGCRYLTEGPEPSTGTVSCTDERLTGVDGEQAVVARWSRACGAYEGGAPAPATCGDYRVSVGVERHDGTVGFVVVDGRGTPDYNPFSTPAMVAAAADTRLALPEVAFAVPSVADVARVVRDHLPRARSIAAPGPSGLIGYAYTTAKLGARVEVVVRVWPSGGDAHCGRAFLVECVERRVYGPDDPTTVLVGTWDEHDWAGCCPPESRADAREFVLVGPRHTVVVSELMIARKDEPTIGADLDEVLIALALDERLQ